MSEKRKYRMEFAGRLIKHLGLHMYTGAVPCLAEFIANSWDAMGRKVEIEIPLNEEIDYNIDMIKIRDNGIGMSYNDCNFKYLILGRDSRKAEGDMTQQYKNIKPRKRMARKGIGKLAGFGIADCVEIRTVKNGEVSHFVLDYDEMIEGDKFVREYEPKIMDDDGKKVDEPDGTLITLSRLKIEKKINRECFRTSIARRFTILSDSSFSVLINGSLLKKIESVFQFRYPEEKQTTKSENVSGIGVVKWWVGLTKEPIPDEEARGISIFSRGKIVQPPFFFDLSGGMYGQHGLQYMTGEVIVEQLDKTDGKDYIATDRSGLLWEGKIPQILKEWGKKKIKEILRIWIDGRKEVKLMRPEVKRYLRYSERLAPKERELFIKFVDKICSIPQLDKDREILDDLVEFGYNALTNHRIIDIIREINSLNKTEMENLSNILSEWSLAETIYTAQMIKGRVEIIKKFRELIKSKAREKPDMQEFVKDYLWLLRPEWDNFVRERPIDSILHKEFGLPKSARKGGRTVPDYFCVGDSGNVFVIELKRPGEKAGTSEIDQIRNYVAFLKERLERETTDVNLKRDVKGGLLICGEMPSESKYIIETVKTLNIEVTTWDCLLRNLETRNRDILDIAKEKINKMSPGDPRIEALNEV